MSANAASSGAAAVAAAAAAANSDELEKERLRPPWALDADVSECTRCGLLFNIFRRRHHCRQCGLVFCNSCADKKLALPHLAYYEPERVCLDCVELAYLVSCTYSRNVVVQKHGALGLAQMSTEPDGYDRLLRSAAFQAIVSMAGAPDGETQLNAAGALANLARASEMHTHLFRAGAVEALLTLARTATQPNVLMNVLGALCNFAQSDESRPQIVERGGLSPIVDLAFREEAALQDMALRCLVQLVMDARVRRIAIAHDGGLTLRRIVSLASVNRREAQRLVAKLLAYVSLADEAQRGRLLELGLLQPLLALASTRNRSVVAHALCALANLAAVEDNREFVGNDDGLRVLWLQLLRSGGKEVDAQRHAVRALCNLSLSESVRERLVRVAGLVTTLLERLPATTNVELLRGTMRLLANLSVCAPVRATLAQSSAMPVLLHFASSDDSELRACARFAMVQVAGQGSTVAAAAATAEAGAEMGAGRASAPVGATAAVAAADAAAAAAVAASALADAALLREKSRTTSDESSAPVPASRGRALPLDLEGAGGRSAARRRRLPEGVGRMGRPPSVDTDSANTDIETPLSDAPPALAVLTQFAAALPLGAPPLGAPPLGAPPLGAPPLGAPPLGAPPLGAPPLGAPPLGAPPLGAPPLGTPPLGAFALPPFDLTSLPGARAVGVSPDDTSFTTSVDGLETPFEY